MLENRPQARLLVLNTAGIVFIPNQEFAHERLKLVLNKQAWLRHLAELERKPFARSINIVDRRFNRNRTLRHHSRLHCP